MPLRRLVLAVVGFSLVAGCASSSASSGTSGTSQPLMGRRGNANWITEDEIRTLGAQVDNAYDLVDRLRPSMMRSRASTTTARDGSMGAQTINVMVYLDDVRIGEVAAMRNIPANQVKEVRYLTPTDATQRWGTGHASGAIQVVTKKG
jgi:hypothetical protein